MTSNNRRLTLDIAAARYLDALERNDFATMAEIWQAAVADPDLSTVLREVHSGLNEEQDLENRQPSGSASFPPVKVSFAGTLPQLRCLMARYQDDDDARPTGEDWRALDGKQAEAIRGDGWQRMDTSTEEDEAGQPWSRRTKLTFVAAALIGVIAFGAWVSTWLKEHRPACILLAGAHYDTNLLFPSNVLGWKGLQDIEDWAPQQAFGERWFVFRKFNRMRRVGDLKQQELTRDATWARLKETLPELRDADFEEHTLVVFLSLYGATDRQGAPVLFADDPLGETVVPVQTIINDLKAVQERAAEKSKPKTIVLILDALPVENHWQLGVFGNPFVAELRKLALPPDMYVMCACAEGERSWASEEWRRSIFAHYVLMGLRGSAGQSGKVTLHDLFDYVKKNVENWTLGNRDMKQTPILLAGDPDAARNVDLVRVDETIPEDAPASAPGNSFGGLSQPLKEEWKKWQELKAGLVWTYAPHLWRQYQDALMRWEHLERVGSTQGPQLRSLADLNRNAINDARALKMSAKTSILSNCMPLAASLGRAPNATARASAQQLWDLWEINRGDKKSLAADKEWKAANDAWEKALKAEKDAPAARYADLLSIPVDAIVHAKDLKREQIDRAARFIEYFAQDSYVRPIEAHALVMLHECALSDAPVDLLREALSVRRLAERTILGVESTDSTNAASYAEFIFPLIRSRIEEADKNRRDGEDYLLGSPKHWEAARKRLAEAAAEFKTIQEETGKLRAALAARDRGWAELPYAAQWLSRLPLGKEHGEAEAALKKAIPTLVDLTKELDKPDVLKNKLNKVEEQAIDLVAKCGALDRIYQDTTKLAKAEANQLLYHQLESVLAMPTLSGDERDKRVRESRRLTESLNTLAVHKVAEDRRKVVFAEPEKLENLARNMYTAALGDDAKGRLFDGLARLPEQIRKGRDESLRKDDFAKGVESAKDALRRPVELCRFIPGGRVALGEGKDAPFTAPECWRRLHAYELMMSLAERTSEDYWCNKDRKTAYYMKPAAEFARAAADLADVKEHTNKAEKELRDKRKKPATELEARLEKPAALTLASVDRKVPWTAQQSFPLKWLVGIDGAVPAGIPMTEMGQPSGPRESIENLWRDRRAPKEYKMQEGMKPKEDDVAKVSLNLLYRGWQHTATVEVKSHTPSVVVQRFIPPPKAHVAIRMDKKLQYEAVSIVLDTSGSMTWKYPDQLDGKGEPTVGSAMARDRRYDRAIDALNQVLSSMPEIKHLSVVRFISEGPKSFPEFYRPVGAWDARRHTQPLIDKLKKLGEDSKALNNSSPIVDAIKLSLESGFPDRSEYDGPKLVLVLTDGADNHSDTAKEPGGAQRFYYDQSPVRYPGISAAVVCFVKKDGKDAKEAKDQFAPKRQSFDRIFEIVEDAADLGKSIGNLIKPVVEISTLDGKWSELRPVNVVGGQLEWKKPLRLEAYKGEVQRRERSDREFHMTSGQNLLLMLTQKSKWFTFERGLVARQPETKDLAIVKDQDWHATLYMTDRHAGKLDQRIFIEKEPQEGVIGQPVPAFTWFEVEPATAKGEAARAAPGKVRWHNEWDWPAPAFRLQVDAWQPKDGAKLNAWWHDQIPPDDGAVTKDLVMEPRGPALNFTLTKSNTQGELTVAVEKHKVEVAPEVYEDRTCLVFRVKHTPGKPVAIRLGRKGWGGGEEHRYYRHLDQEQEEYTALFYPWVDVDAKEVRFTLMCVESFKGQARHAPFAPQDDVRARNGDLFFQENRVDQAPAP